MFALLLLACATPPLPAEPAPEPTAIVAPAIVTVDDVPDVASIPVVRERRPLPATRSFRDCIRGPDGEWICSHPVTTGVRREVPGHRSGPGRIVYHRPSRHPQRDPTAIVEPWGIDTRVVRDTSVVRDTRIVDEWDPLRSTRPRAMPTCRHPRTTTAPDPLASLDRPMSTDPVGGGGQRGTAMGVVTLASDGSWTRPRMSTRPNAVTGTGAVGGWTPSASMSSVPVAQGSTAVITGFRPTAGPIGGPTVAAPMVSSGAAIRPTAAPRLR